MVAPYAGQSVQITTGYGYIVQSSNDDVCRVVIYIWYNDHIENDMFLEFGLSIVSGVAGFFLIEEMYIFWLPKTELDIQDHQFVPATHPPTWEMRFLLRISGLGTCFGWLGSLPIILIWSGKVSWNWSIALWHRKQASKQLGLKEMKSYDTMKKLCRRCSCQ